jgi:two-component system nitrate/nitrite response regulator NarL
MGVTRIVLCDDHEIVREAIRRRIEPVAEAEVVGEAASGDEAIAKVRELKPDLLITDVELPGTDGIATAAELIKDNGSLRVLVISAHDEPELVSLAADSGVSGFIGKGQVTTEIAQAIEAIRTGRNWFPEGTDIDEDLGDGLRRLRTLSPRERQILDLFATGMRAQGVAEVIGIRTATVYTHVRNAIHKLNVDSRTEAVAIATRYNYLANALNGDDRA